MEIKMIKQDWMIIVAGHELVDAMEIEQKATCRLGCGGYNSDDLSMLHGNQSRRGIRGCEIVKAFKGYSVRSDCGLQNFALLATSSDLGGGSLEQAEQFAHDWVAKDPTRRYAWRRRERQAA
jgi:hypothetical protein